MSSAATTKSAAASRVLLVIGTFVDFAVSLIALSFSFLGLININRLAYNVFHIALWILWLICANPLAGLMIYWLTLALTGIIFVEDVVLAINDLFVGFNCIVAGTNCPSPPDTGYTIALLAIVEVFYSFIVLFQFLAILNLIYATYQDQRNTKEKDI